MEKMKSRLSKNLRNKYVFIALLLILGAYISFNMVRKIHNYDYSNEIRIITKDTTEKVENGNFDIDNELEFFIVDLSGTVTYSNDKNTEENTSVNIKEILEYDKAFAIKNNDKVRWSTPFIINGKQSGNIVYLIKEESILGEKKEVKLMKAFTPLILAIVITLLIMLYDYISFNKYIVKPIRKITNSSKRIIQGDFSENINYYDNGEVGELAKSFEEMRDEIKTYIDREKKSNNSEKELIAALSHDIKTPLSAIKAYMEGIRDGIAKTEEQRLKYSTIILTKVDSLNKMLDELLDVSKIGLSEMKFTRSEVYFREYILGIAEDIELMTNRNNVEFTFSEDISNVIVNMDKKRISQVIYNLIENAIKYSENNKKIKLKILEENKWIKMQIVDNGKGISKEDINLIFEKFYRAEKSRSSSVPGSGLGLYICRYIIEGHGGEIKCESEISKGSIFTIHLPIY